MNERVAIGGGVSKRGSGAIATAVDLWSQRAQKDAVTRDRLMQIWVEAEVGRLTNLRAREMRQAGTPGPEGSVGKLAMAEINKRIWECGLDVLGSEALVYEAGYELRRPSAEDRRSAVGLAKYQFLRSRANSIEGGTSEVMRNILGERVLGLPGEPRVDKGVPWKDIPRG
jgi:alkylation response protein AidB-like acyl-CoA dehydrogenase